MTHRRWRRWEFLRQDRRPNELWRARYLLFCRDANFDGPTELPGDSLHPYVPPPTSTS